MTRVKHHSSPFQSPRGQRHEDSSPSRQLHFELERTFNQMHLHDVECQKLHAYQRRQQREDLDAQECAQAEIHQAEITGASAQHEIIRQHAEAVLRAYLQQEAEERRRREEERIRREAEERQRREDEERRQRAEAERRAQEEKERRERRDREERARAEAERAAIQEKEKATAAAAAAAEEKRRQERDAEKKRRDEKARAEADLAAARLKQETDARPPAATTAPSPLPTAHDPASASHRSSTEFESRHAHYLALHKKIKAFRNEFWDRAKKDPSLKPHVGDMRRAMRTSVGQLTDDKAGNRKAHERVRSTLHKALHEVPSPPVSVHEYLQTSATAGAIDGDLSATIPSLVLYLLSIFSKAIISAFVGECAVNPKAAEPIGTLVAQIFSMPELQFPRGGPSGAGSSTASPPSHASLIAVLMCKFHASAPILFGISGSEGTANGRLRLGWRLDRVSDDKKAFVPENKQYDRLTGLGVGYASIALRNFSKAKIQNPWPPVHYWASLASVINTPAAEVQTSHLILLKSMLENNAVDRFVLFFGAAAVAALRQATVDFPRSLSPELQQKPATKALVLMADGWRKEKHFSLK